MVLLLYSLNFHFMFPTKIAVFIVLLVALSGGVLYGQANPNARCYSYDAAGNRINRYSCPGKHNTLELLATEGDLSHLVVFPNPTQGVCSIKTDGLPAESVVQLSSINGVVMWQRALGNGQFDISSLPVGMYLLTLQYNGQQKTTRLLKE